MSEKKYKVVDSRTGEIFAADITLDIACALIRGFCDAFYSERVDLRLVEIGDEVGN